MCAPYAVLWCMGPGEGGGGACCAPQEGSVGCGTSVAAACPRGGSAGSEGEELGWAARIHPPPPASLCFGFGGGGAQLIGAQRKARGCGSKQIPKCGDSTNPCWERGPVAEMTDLWVTRPSVRLKLRSPKSFRLGKKEVMVIRAGCSTVGCVGSGELRGWGFSWGEASTMCSHPLFPSLAAGPEAASPQGCPQANVGRGDGSSADRAAQGGCLQCRASPAALLQW